MTTDLKGLSGRLAATIGVTETELASMAEAARIAAAHYRPLLIEANRALEAMAGEVERLKRMLFPYAEDKEISGMSLDGFYLIGNKKSIDELKRMENRSAQLETYRAEFVRRNEAAEAERDRLAGEVAFVKAQLAGTNKNIAGWLQARDDAMKRAEAAEAERDRLKAALDYCNRMWPNETARKALGGDA